MAEALATLERASIRAGCRFDIDYSKGASLLLPHLSDVRKFSRIVCAAARQKVADGDAEEAWRVTATALRLADAC
ncbi:hypothetical protein NL533_30540, partial [Klebsiella pneumoniae]|nr:hypothetical protein [Klebsiella pneumoniae]